MKGISFPKIIEYLIWWGRIFFKSLLLSLHIPYVIFQRIGLFRHGAMDNSDYAENMWVLHYNAVCQFGNVDKESSFLELGPGDSLSSAFSAKKEGFNHAVLLDVGAFATNSRIELELLNCDKRSCYSQSINHTCFICEYLTDGETSLKVIEDSSASFVFSNSVLQHIGRDDVDAVLKQLYRLTNKGGRQSHVIDLRDMISRSSLHYLCPAWLWESKFFKKLPIYTNRLNCTYWVEVISDVGFEILDLKLYDDEGQVLDTQLASFDPHYLISNIHIVLEKK